MLRRKIRESLTARIFLLTFALLLGAGAITFGCIAWATPITYTAVISSAIEEQMNELVDRLAQTEREDCGPLLDEFIRSAGADAMLLGADGKAVDTGSQLAVYSLYENDNVVVLTAEDSGKSDGIAFGVAGSMWEDSVLSITGTATSVLTAEVTFLHDATPYELYVQPYAQPENQAVQALLRAAPWLLLAMLVFSAGCALLYSRYITRPIIRLSGIARRMEHLDFDWQCAEKRRDEIGALGRSLDGMAQKLKEALTSLQAANEALRSDMERERELERQRLAFFSAASHELKTPVTILKGQLTGMLDGVSVYRDRDKYLARSLAVTARMEELIREILTVSRLESDGAPVKIERFDLSELVQEQLEQDEALFEQRGLRLRVSLSDGVPVLGERALLGRAVENLLSNAAHYSPAGAEVRVSTRMRDSRPVLTVENTRAHLSEADIPHLFEAFYRAEQSRNRRTGGSGLGLYLVRMILQRCHAVCTACNTPEGVCFTITFPPLD